MTPREFFARLRFWRTADRIGPDIPTTHWRLYFRSTMRKLCQAKFRRFHDTADFRPGAYAMVCSKISIGRNAVIRPGTVLIADEREGGAGIVIEDDVLTAPGIQLHVKNHVFSNPNLPIHDQGYGPSKEIVLKKGCWIGANSVILSGVTVGENSVVGAGSIVTKSIPPRVVAAGNPARVLRRLDEPKPV